MILGALTTSEFLSGVMLSAKVAPVKSRFFALFFLSGLSTSFFTTYETCSLRFGASAFFKSSAMRSAIYFLVSALDFAF